MKKKYILPIVLTALCAILLAAGIVLAQGEFEEMTGWRQFAYAALNRTKLENTEFVGRVSTDTWSETDEYSRENTAVVQKDPNTDFVVMNLTDIHMADFDYYGAYNVRLFTHIRAMAEEYQPDLITISGDLFSSDSVALSVHMLADFMDSLSIPWAPVFGNHDDGGNCDLNYLADVMMESEYCLMQKGDPDLGVGNYTVNICEGDKIVHSLIMIDTHGDGLWEDQIEWYKWAASGANAPSTAILHIPLPEYQDAYDAAWDGNSWKESFEAFGGIKESICPENNPTDFFAAVKEVGLTENIICGHDHTNDFCVLYEGVRLTYSMRLGIFGNHHPENQGATLLTIQDDGSTEIEHVQRYD